MTKKPVRKLLSKFNLQAVNFPLTIFVLLLLFVLPTTVMLGVLKRLKSPAGEEQEAFGQTAICTGDDAIDAFSFEGWIFWFIKDGRIFTFDGNSGKQYWLVSGGTPISEHTWFGLIPGGPCTVENCQIDGFSGKQGVYRFIKDGKLWTFDSNINPPNWTTKGVPLFDHPWFGKPGGPCTSTTCQIDGFDAEEQYYRFIKEGKLWTFDSNSQTWTTQGQALSEHPWFGKPGGPCYAPPTPTTTPTPTALNILGQQLGLEITYNGDVNNLQITEIENNVYQIKANTLACTPGTAGCEPDRYQVTFNKDIPYIFGLGREVLPWVALKDFLDLNFSIGHYPMHTGEYRYSGDNGRLRIPMFVLPKEKIIIAYFQPEVKRVRLLRENNTTQIVTKKHEQYPGGGPGTLLLIKGSSIADAYQKYNQYLKQTGYFFKKPHWKAFGLGWETFEEYACDTSATKVKDAVDQYKAQEIKLHSVTIGSGYWQYDGSGECNSQLVNKPTTDKLEANQQLYEGKAGLNALWNELLNDNIYPLVGMRHCVYKDNANFITNKFSQVGINNPFYSSHIYYGNAPSDNARYLDANRQEVISKYIDFLTDAYGQFKGFKEDEMFFGDQLANGGTANFPDGLASKIFKIYDEKFNHDFISVGSSDYFGVGTDLQETYGWETPADRNLYYTKNTLESALTQVASGYPHPNLENFLLDDLYNGNQDKEFLRTIQLQTFVAGDTHSKGFWHLTNNDYKNGVVYFSNLRNRLHQYIYDQAQSWYETGIPTLMRLLYIDYPDDNNVYNLYTQLAGDTANIPKDEYMFGKALLVRPVYNDVDGVRIYLPGGDWLPLFQTSPTILSGNQYVSYTVGVQDYPVFLKKGKLLLIQENEQLNNLQAYFFLGDLNNSEEYTLYKKEGGTVRLQALRKGDGSIWVKNINNNVEVQASPMSNRGYMIAPVQFLVEPIPTPTRTPTPIPPTPTPTPLASLNFKIKFQGISLGVASGKSVRVILKQGGVEKYRFDSVGLVHEQGGVYSGTINNVSPGTYDVLIKGWAHLQRKFNTSLTSAGKTEDWSGTLLLAGDIDFNGRITSLDLGKVLDDYWPDTPANSPADLNLDSKVSALDLGPVLDNYFEEDEK